MWGAGSPTWLPSWTLNWGSCNALVPCTCSYVLIAVVLPVVNVASACNFVSPCAPELLPVISSACPTCSACSTPFNQFSPPCLRICCPPAHNLPSNSPLVDTVLQSWLSFLNPRREYPCDAESSTGQALCVFHARRHSLRLSGVLRTSWLPCARLVTQRRTQRKGGWLWHRHVMCMPAAFRVLQCDHRLSTCCPGSTCR
jgi:hypothetical protein